MVTQEPRHEVRGRVINLGRSRDRHGAPRRTLRREQGGAIYLTKQIAVDYAQDLIVCNCISPGKIVTGQPGFPWTRRCSKTLAGAPPWPRWVAADIANAAVFLASDRATYRRARTSWSTAGGWRV